MTIDPAVLARFTRCRACGRPQESLQGWHCACGGIFSLRALHYRPGHVDKGRPDLARYRAFLPLPEGGAILGAGWTPIREAAIDGRPIRLKDERANPTGSFKDRGMAVLVNAAAGAREPVFVDSVGNTAAALAAYAKELDLEAHVFAPLSTTTPERARIVTDLGARLHRVAGPRSESGKVAMATAGDGALYLSHIYQPLFQAGTATCAFEIAEQLVGANGRTAKSGVDGNPESRAGGAPWRIFTAVGQGSLFLGLYHGFRALVEAQVIARSPALFAVRPEIPGQTIAVGAAAVAPVRAQEFRLAADASGGEIVPVPDTELLMAHEALLKIGYDVDPAASMALAGWRRIVARDGPAADIVILCGARREAVPVTSRR